MKKTYIIAEAGVNHNGSLELAHKLIDAAVFAGADAVKFQTFKAENIVTKTAPKAEYQKKTTGNEQGQFEMLKALELDESVYFELLEHAKNSKIDFLSTPFDIESLNFLFNELGLDTLKIPSGEITNAPLIFEGAKKADKIILSTGMSTMQEVEDALSIIALALVCPEKTPEKENFASVLNSAEGQKRLKECVTLLHCTSEYPAPPETINLSAMYDLRDTFGLAYGLSDHSDGIAIPVTAVGMGATLIEKHFTLDKTLDGPDHKASLEPNELKEMIQNIRIIEQAIGTGKKKPFEIEKKTAFVVRKSLVAAKPIKKGEIFTEKNVTTKRPANGLSPFKFWKLLGASADKDYKTDEPLFIKTE